MLSFLIVFIGTVLSCTKKEKKIETPSAGTVALSGEITTPDTRVYVGDGAYGPYTYLWNKTPTKTITILFMQAVAPYTKATVTTTLNIQPDRKCKFTVPAANVPAWFNGDPDFSGDGDFVAGAIDVSSVNASTSEWTFTQPTSFNALGEIYQPMYFPLTRTSGYFVGPLVFETLGSVLAIRIHNNTDSNYQVARLLRVQGGAFTNSGVVSFATPPTEGGQPTWVQNAGSPTFNINNIPTLTPGATDTVYVWMKQKTGTFDPGTVTVATENTLTYGLVVERPEPGVATPSGFSGWQGGSFYGLELKLNWYDVPQWTKCYGGTGDDVAKAIRQTSDGGYIIAGYSPSLDGNVTGNHGDNDYWVVKLKPNGTLDWEKSLGGSGEGQAYAVQQTNDDGYIVAGYTTSTDGDITSAHGGNDVWIVKLYADGTLDWEKSYGGSSDDRATAIQQTSDGGYIIAGYTFSVDGDVKGKHNTVSTSDYWVVKLDANGDTAWTKCLGGNVNEEAYAVQETSDGGYIVSGFSSSIPASGDVTGNHGDYDYWIVKLKTAVGVGGKPYAFIEWQKSLGGTGKEIAYSVREVFTNGSPDGYIVAGYTGSANGDVVGKHGGNDFWIIKLTATGDTTWTKCLGGSGGEIANAIRQTSDGGYIIAGYGNTTTADGDLRLCYKSHGGNDYWIVKLDTFHNIAWQKSFGGTAEDIAYDIQQTSDGGYVVAGVSRSTGAGNVVGNHGSSGVGDYWIVKLTPSGTTP
jgi:hypothetical protein